MRNPRGKTRIAFFIAYPQRMAGANRSLMELVTNLPPKIEPLVIVVAEGPVAEEYRSRGLKPHILEPGPSLNRFGKVSLNWSVAKRAKVAVSELLPYTLRLRNWLKRNGVDLLHVNDPRGALLAGPAAKAARLPVVSHLRGTNAIGGVYWSLFERISDHVITVCNAVQEDLSPAARRKATTVYNGSRCIYPEDRSMPWLQKLRSEGVKVVSCFASVTPFKGIHHLLRAAALLNSRGYRDQFIVLCVGDIVPHDQDYFVWLDQERVSLGVNNFTFAGWQSQPFDFYRYTDISVLPTAANEVVRYAAKEVKVLGNEGFPRTHLEAMCFGIPTIGTRIAGVPEQILQGVTGLVVEPSDTEQLAQAVGELLGDAEKRRRMGQAGRQRVLETFSTRAYVEGVLRVYDSILGTNLADDAHLKGCCAEHAVGAPVA